MKKCGLCVLLVLAASAVALAADTAPPRVFITDSQSWEMRGSGSAYGGSVSGGARGQTAELIKTFGEKCPNARVNNNREKADYVVVFDHEGGKSWYRKDSKIAVFNYDGDSILSKSTRSLGGSVEEACKVVLADWEQHGSARTAALAAKEAAEAAKATAKADPPPAAVPAKPMESANHKVQVNSEPAGADIEVDGSFVGNTPSSVELAPGEHTVAVKKSGYKPWERKLKVSGGDINLNAELEKMPPATE